MNEHMNGKVILFPRSSEYYQAELTRMLESDRFQEAAELLRFLLNCQGEEPEMYAEWRALLEWLEDRHDSERQPVQELDEREMFSEYVSSRMKKDIHYTDRLLEMLVHHPSLEKKMIALDQLAYADDSAIDHALKQWLAEKELHPLLQYKALQTLKFRKAQGEAILVRGGERVSVLLQDVPLTFAAHPDSVQQVLAAVRRISDTDNPSLAYFAGQIWHVFVAMVYLTAIYRKLAAADETSVHIWAAALHAAAAETMASDVRGAEILRMYGLKEQHVSPWEKARSLIKEIFAQAEHTGQQS